jgi:hypothetical protein
MVRRPTGRAQLILVGSLTLAFVVISLAVVFNGLAYVESVSTGDGSEALDDAEQFDHSAVDGTRRLVLYVNHATIYGGQTALNDSVRANLTTYSALRAESHAAARPGHVRLEYHGIETAGTRVLQDTDGNFTVDGTASGAASWTPTDSRQVGWFVLNLDAPNVSDTTGADRFTIVVNDADGDTGRLFVSRNTTTGSDSATIDIETDLPGTMNDTSRRPCAPSQDRLLLDLRSGKAFGDYCRFNLTGPLEQPYEVTFEHGDMAAGKYAIVVEGAPSTSPNTLGACPASGPCNAWTVWTATVTTTYESRDASHTHTRNVTIYS